MQFEPSPALRAFLAFTRRLVEHKTRSKRINIIKPSQTLSDFSKHGWRAPRAAEDYRRVGIECMTAWLENISNVQLCSERSHRNIMHVVIVSSPKFKMDDVNIVVPGLLNVFVHTVDISVILYSERTSTQLYTLYVNRDTEREREYFMLGLKGLWATVAGLLRNTSIFRPFFSSVLCFLRAGRLPVGLDIFSGSWKGRKIRKLELSIKVQVCLGADLQLWSIYIYNYIL